MNGAATVKRAFFRALSGMCNFSALAILIAATSGVAFADNPLDPGGGTVPEIDPSSISGAVAMLTSGVLLFTASRRSK